MQKELKKFITKNLDKINKGSLAVLLKKEQEENFMEQSLFEKVLIDCFEDFLAPQKNENRDKKNIASGAICLSRVPSGALAGLTYTIVDNYIIKFLNDPENGFIHCIECKRWGVRYNDGNYCADCSWVHTRDICS